MSTRSRPWCACRIGSARSEALRGGSALRSAMDWEVYRRWRDGKSRGGSNERRCAEPCSAEPIALLLICDCCHAPVTRHPRQAAQPSRSSRKISTLARSPSPFFFSENFMSSRSRRSPRFHQRFMPCGTRRFTRTPYRSSLTLSRSDRMSFPRLSLFV